MKHIILAIKGAIIGVANVVPGVSGGTLALILDIYDKLISSISNIFKEFKKSFLFLLPIIIGIGIGTILSSKVVDIGLAKCPLATILLFVGMILGGIPLLFKKIKNDMKNPLNYVIFVVIFVGFLLCTFLSKNRVISQNSINWYDYFLFFGLGIIGAGTMIIPGVSGSLTLMSIGYYDLIVRECVSHIFDFSKIGFHLQVLIPFALGCIVGILLVAKIVNFLLNKFEVKTYFGIFGFIFASLISIFKINLTSYSIIMPNFIIELIVGLILLFIGFSLSYSISNKGVYIGIYKVEFKGKKK